MTAEQAGPQIVVQVLRGEREPGGAKAERRMETLLRNVPVRERLLSLFRKTFSGGGAAVLSEDGEEQTARLALLRI